MADNIGKIRVDKWLWHARFFKTRSLAGRQVSDGSVRVNGTPVNKRATTVGPDDVLTFAQGNQIRVIKVVGLGTRRGPATEAQTLYEDISPPVANTQNTHPDNPGFDGKGRPTKKDRRQIDLSKMRHLE